MRIPKRSPEVQAPLFLKTSTQKKKKKKYSVPTYHRSYFYIIPFSFFLKEATHQLVIAFKYFMWDKNTQLCSQFLKNE